MAAAADIDNWRTQYSPNGKEADRILYNWTQGGSDNGFSTPGYASTTWTAPLAAGTYTLTCTIYDDATIPQNDEQGGVSNPSSSRTDAPVVRTVNVIVVAPCGVWSHVRWESGGTVTWTDPEGTPTISDALARQSWSDSCANTTKADRTVGVAYAKSNDTVIAPVSIANNGDGRYHRKVTWRAPSISGSPQNDSVVEAERALPYHWASNPSISGGSLKAPQSGTVTVAPGASVAVEVNAASDSVIFP